MREVGNCNDDDLGFIDSEEDCVAAATFLKLGETTPTVLTGDEKSAPVMPHGCYVKSTNMAGNRLWFNNG